MTVSFMLTIWQSTFRCGVKLRTSSIMDDNQAIQGVIETMDAAINYRSQLSLLLDSLHEAKSQASAFEKVFCYLVFNFISRYQIQLYEV